jgi:hypothetical protein
MGKLFCGRFWGALQSTADDIALWFETLDLVSVRIRLMRARQAILRTQWTNLRPVSVALSKNANQVHRELATSLAE